MRVLRWILLVLLTGAIVATGGVYWLLQRSVPDIAPDIAVQAHTANVSAPVRIFYDQRQRPFVYAESFNDAFFAQGYLHATHRLWQMDMFRRAGLGRISEMIGSAGLETDTEIWRAGVPELARRMAKVASPTLQQSIKAYVEGINAYLQTQPALPPEYLLLQSEPRPWQAEDVFALGALMAYQSANNLTNELLRLTVVEELGPAKASIFFPPATSVPDPMAVSLNTLHNTLARIELTRSASNPLFSAPALGSNAWAVAPNLSATDNALFAFDSHDSVSLPNLTYDVHLFVGNQQIRGNSVPGLLGVINGFNEFMAWGFTNIGDSQDAFIEPDDTVYQIKTVSIPVRGQPAAVVEIATSTNGRRLSTNPSISVRWSPLEPHNFGLDALLALNRATSFEQFNAALDKFVAPSATATYADITGRVAQRTIGLLPKRGYGAGLIPLPADNPDNTWSGVLDMRTLPATSKTEGYVAAANRPFTHTQQLISADNAPGYRVRRIESVLQSRADHTVASMLALQTDDTNLQAQRLLPSMLATIKAELPSITPQQAQAVALLEEWSARAVDRADLVAPTLFAQWYQALIAELFEPVLSSVTYQALLKRSYLINEAIDNHLLTQPSDWPVSQALVASFIQAVKSAGDTTRWGDQHTLLLKHELGAAFPGADLLFNRGPYPASGGNATVGRARYSHARPFDVSGGATTRMVLEMSNPIQAWMISPGGQSGHPLSPVYNDQTSGWLAGKSDKIEPPNTTQPHLTLTPH